MVASIPPFLFSQESTIAVEAVSLTKGIPCFFGRNAGQDILLCQEIKNSASLSVIRSKSSKKKRMEKKNNVKHDQLVSSVLETHHSGSNHSSNNNIGRSDFHVKQMCCATEISSITRVLQSHIAKKITSDINNSNKGTTTNQIYSIASTKSSKKGIHRISFITPLRMLYVHHNPDILSAREISSLLKRGGFGTLLKKDCGDSIRSQRDFIFKKEQEFQKRQDEHQQLCIQKTIENNSQFTENSCRSGLSDLDDSRSMSSHISSLSFISSNSISGLTKKSSSSNSTASSIPKMVRTYSNETNENSSSASFQSNRRYNKYDENDENNQKHDIKSKDDTAALESNLVMEEEEQTLTRLNPLVFLSGLFWIISVFSSLIGGKWENLSWTALVSVTCGIPNLTKKAFNALNRHEFDVNCMMLFAIFGALTLQDYEEAASVSFLFSLSEYLEGITTDRAHKSLKSLLDLRPETANCFMTTANFDEDCNNEEVLREVPASSVPPGSMVCVRPGDKTPCDGIIISGNTILDESNITGESKPVSRHPGDVVSGGTMNVGYSRLCIQTTHTVDDSAVSKLIQLVEESQCNRSDVETMMDTFASWYTPIVLGLAICLCTIPWIVFGKEIGRQCTEMGLVLVVMACPCALIISTPITYVAGLTVLAQNGILVKGGAHLESLGRVGTIAFDKTGTLTRGEFQVIDFQLIGNHSYTKTEVLEHLLLIQESSSHPLATGIVSYARKERVTQTSKQRNIMKLMNQFLLEGEGVVGTTTTGITIHAGNARMFNRLGLLTTLSTNDMDTAKKWSFDEEGSSTVGCTIGFMSIKGDIVCMYRLQDTVRSESREVITSLTNDLHIETVMLTGDNHSAANAIGEEIGIPRNHIHSQLLPKEKLDIISQLKIKKKIYCSAGRKNIGNRNNYNCNLTTMNNFFKQTILSIFSLFIMKKEQSGNLVLMCGDGINDAPALAAADVGLAMGSGSALPMETSDVILIDSDLSNILFSIEMGRKVHRVIFENIVLSLLAKLIVMALTLWGYTALWAAIASDLGAMLIVTQNGMKLLNCKKTKKGT